MAYTRNPTWQDHPDTSTPITAAKLEHIEDGIEDPATRPTRRTAMTERPLTVKGARQLISLTAPLPPGWSMYMWVPARNTPDSTAARSTCSL